MFCKGFLKNCRNSQENTCARTTDECFDKLFVLVKNNVAESTTNMRDASTPNLKLTTETFHTHSFVVNVFLIFFLYGDLKF